MKRVGKIAVKSYSCKGEIFETLTLSQTNPGFYMYAVQVF